MDTSDCPPLEDILGLLLLQGPREVAEHVRGCRNCAARLEGARMGMELFLAEETEREESRGDGAASPDHGRPR